MFAKETYMQRRALLKKNLGSEFCYFWEMTSAD